MTKLKLHYFDFPGGRGEPARIALRATNIEFEDVRMSMEEFGQNVSQYPLRQVPVLEVDGVKITQSNAINRYTGKMAGLYPQDDVQALLCDEIMDAMEDLISKLVHTFFMTGDEQKQAREKLCETAFPLYLGFLENKLMAAGGEYFADNRLTMADLKVFLMTRHLVSGALDHVPPAIVEQYAPSVLQHMHRVAEFPYIQTP